MTTTQKIDRVVTNRILGIPIFIVIMFFVYWLAVSVGGYRDFRWRSRGRAQQSALYCTVQPATAEMIAGYEKELDLLRDRMVRAERTCNEEAALIERLRSDLSLSRNHAKNLEKTLNEVTSSTFWAQTEPF